MRGKTDRLNTIKSIISTEEIGSQDDLLQRLQKEGFELTQATLSRDLKQLKVAKASTHNGNYIYVLQKDIIYKPNHIDTLNENEQKRTGFISIEYSGNLAVIKTQPGYASRLAYDIDADKNDYILGTIAGDDTILLVIRENISQEQVTNYVMRLIKTIQ